MCEKKRASETPLQERPTTKWVTHQNGLGNIESLIICGCDHIKDVKKSISFFKSDILHKNFKECIGLLLEVKRAILTQNRLKAELLTSYNASSLSRDIRLKWAG